MRRACYLPAVAVGILAALCMLPWDMVAGWGGLWGAPGGDAAMALTGHLAYQAPGWHWPLLLAQDLAWPEGRSIALTDSNPLVSICAKLLCGVTGRRANLLGVWLEVCWILQPMAAVFAFRALARRLRIACRWEACAAVAMLSVLCPAWLIRVRHVNLMCHFLLTAALGQSLRMRAERRGDWTVAGLLLCVAILTHPYMFVFAAIILGAPVVHAAMRKEALSRVAGLYAVSCAVPLGMLLLMSGNGGGNASGFGHYSMNVLSPVWPQRSGLFGADLPILDATGGQYEGFNYQGGGVLLLVCVAFGLALSRPPRGAMRALGAWGLMLCVMVALAVSPRVYAGHALVIGLPLQPWRGLFAAIQSSGRAFWVVGYAGLFGAVAMLSHRLSRAPAAGLLALAILLQFWDTWPLRAGAMEFLEGRGQVAPPFQMAEGARLLRIVPACDPVNAPGDQLRLLAVRAGLMLADMRMARQPRGFDCETATSDGLELPLGRWEMRFFLPSAVAAFRAGPLGGGACSGVAGGMLCAGGGLAAPAGLAVSPGIAVAELPEGPSVVSGDALAPFLATGWQRGAGGGFWSEGPIATLLFSTAEKRTIVLELDGIAEVAGGARVVSVRVGDGQPEVVTLAEGARSDVRVAVPGGVTRVVFGLRRPVDPDRRGLDAPVRRAAIRLFDVRVEKAVLF